MESKPPAFEPQTVSSLLDQLWVKFLPQIQDRVSTLQQAVDALAQGDLRQNPRADAHSAAHKLAGSLGTFGLDQGTALAREAELLLAPQAHLDSTAKKRLAAISAEIQIIILTRRASQ